MRATKIACVAVVLVIALLAVIGLAKTRNRAVEKDEVQTSRAPDAVTTVAEKPASKPEPAALKAAAEAAIGAAAKQNRYVFLTFYKRNDAASTKMLAEAKKLQAKYSSRANFVSADVGNAVHQEIISRYGADRSPIPLTLVIAPNGAVTAGYPNEIKKTDISDAFVSSGMADVLKVLQSSKLALVCLQNGKTKFNKESMTAAEGLKADKTLPGLVEIVKIDPSDSRESKFLQQCKANAGSANAQVVMIIPPGRILGTFDGNTTKDKLMAGLQSAMKSCGSSCGPSGCGP
jgi:hypothetical protein